MKPNHGARIPALDGLRGLAILMVMLGHFSSRLNEHRAIQSLVRSAAKNFGWTGVDLFFVLSGFLITGILLDTREARNYFSGFYARRALRIFPLYYISLIGIFFVLVPALHFQAVPRRSIAAYALYFQNWLSLDVAVARQFWSLAIEEQFYFFWPFAVYVLGPKRILRVAGAGILLSAMLRFALLNTHVIGRGFIYTDPFTRMDALFAGALIACLIREPAWRRRLSDGSKYFWLAPVLGLAILKFTPRICSEFGIRNFNHAGYPLVSISYAALLASLALGESPVQRFFSASILKTLGKYSYAMYVWHLMTAELVYRAETHVFARPLPQLLNIPILIAATLAVAMASYALIERPFLALKRLFEPRLTTKEALTVGL
jgi:peptidoglycan/LPS O-acetylase OafA/YrhL